MDTTPEQRISEIAAEFAATPGGLLPALHAVQHAFGHVPPESVRPLAEAFNRSTAEIHGVVSFYADFRTDPPIGPVVQVCRAEACQARGADDVLARARSLADGGAPVEVAEVFCLGNCALGPSVTVAGRLHGRVTVADVEGLLAGAGDPVSAAAGDGVVASVSGPRVYVPRDAAARAVGADDVATALAESGAGMALVRNGSRGMLWLEPLVEVDTPAGRVAYGPVGAGDVPGLLAAGLLDGGDHPLRLGLTEDLPWMRRQQRVTFRRVGVIDPRSADEFEANGGLTGLRRALTMTPADVVQEVTASGLRGRGGAAFPTGIKWRTVLEAAGPQKYVCCNADEGDSGTFADRMLMEGDPFTLVEGMVIAGYAVGAHHGYVYVRSEYPDAVAALDAAVSTAREQGWLGPSVLGSGFAFEIEVRVGAGAYICGEETSMLEEPRGQPWGGAGQAAAAGVGRPLREADRRQQRDEPGLGADDHLRGSGGLRRTGGRTQPGDQGVPARRQRRRGGIVETAFGITLGELVEDFGGGTATGRPVHAVQVGGPLGAYLPTSEFGLPMDYEAFAAAGAMVGHGGIVVFDDSVDLARQARFAMEFCAAESCGKCTPCRIGSTRGVEVIDRIVAGVDREQNLALLEGPVRGDGRCVPVRHGRVDPDAGAQCSGPLPARFPPHVRRHPMSRVHVPDLGTPAPDRRERIPAPATVELIVDGRPVAVAEGTSVMRAAALAGVDVPKLCATDRLDAFGSCRPAGRGK